MNNPQFSVLYNGQPVAVTLLSDDRFFVQVSYKPIHIELKKAADGTDEWVEAETQQPTFVTSEIGKLIADRLYSVR